MGMRVFTGTALGFGSIGARLAANRNRQGQYPDNIVGQYPSTATGRVPGRVSEVRPYMVTDEFVSPQTRTRVQTITRTDSDNKIKPYIETYTGTDTDYRQEIKPYTWTDTKQTVEPRTVVTPDITPVPPKTIVPFIPWMPPAIPGGFPWGGGGGSSGGGARHGKYPWREYIPILSEFAGFGMNTRRRSSKRRR
jgi:hypothetical protein